MGLTFRQTGVKSVTMTEHDVCDRVVANIRKDRSKRGWSMAELAARAGLSENVIENIESGRRDKTGRRRRHITADEIEAIEVALFGQPLRGSLFVDPDWEEKNLEENHRRREEFTRMMKDPDLAAAQHEWILASEVMSEAQNRLDEQTRRWRGANGA